MQKKDVKFNCPIHGEVTSQVYSKDWNAWDKNKPIEWSEPKCPLCEKIKTIHTNLYPERKENTLDNFDAYSPQLKKLHAEILSYVKNLQYQQKHNLILVGGVGVGKTHLACAIINYAVKHYAMNCYYKYEGDLLAMGYIKQGWKDSNNKTYKEYDLPKNVYDKYYNCELLVIDDVASKDAWTSADKDIYTNIIHNRYEYKKPTIITSNYPIKNTDKQKTDLQKLLGKRIIDRMLADKSLVITIQAESYRTKNN